MTGHLILGIIIGIVAACLVCLTVLFVGDCKDTAVEVQKLSSDFEVLKEESRNHTKWYDDQQRQLNHVKSYSDELYGMIDEFNKRLDKLEAEDR